MTSPVPYSATIALGQPCPVVAVVGDLDLSSSRELESVFEEALGGGTDGDIVVDMSGLGFLDSWGLSVLITTQTFCAQGRRLSLRAVPVQVARVIAVFRLTEFLTTVLSCQAPL